MGEWFRSWSDGWFEKFGETPEQAETDNGDVHHGLGCLYTALNRWCDLRSGRHQLMVNKGCPLSRIHGVRHALHQQAASKNTGSTMSNDRDAKTAP